MSITKKDVAHVANLARLAISPEQIDTYTDQLSRILKHVEKLSEIDTTGIEPTTSTVPPSSLRREDVAKTVLTNEDALKNAPLSERGCIKVPQIIE